MPCNCDGYSRTRGMEPDEAWRSLSRHHQVTEIELEHLRIAYKSAASKLQRINQLFPSMDTQCLPAPPETPPWTGQTYRDKDGKIPDDIVKTHIDWLSDMDYHAQ